MKNVRVIATLLCLACGIGVASADAQSLPRQIILKIETETNNSGNDPSPCITTIRFTFRAGRIFEETPSEICYIGGKQRRYGEEGQGVIYKPNKETKGDVRCVYNKGEKTGRCSDGTVFETPLDETRDWTFTRTLISRITETRIKFEHRHRQIGFPEQRYVTEIMYSQSGCSLVKYEPPAKWIWDVFKVIESACRIVW